MPLAASILNLSKEIAAADNADEHKAAVLAQIAFANNIFEGIIAVCEKKNGLSAEALLRTLFESLCNALILAKHPEMLADFIAHGRMTELRMQRVIETPALKQRLEKTIKETESEFKQLWAKFNERRWNGLSTKEAFAEAEFGDNVYDRYYRRASAISHGQPYVTTRGDKVSARPTAWANMSVGAENMAMLMLLTALAIVSRELELGKEPDITNLQKELDPVLKQHMNQIEKQADL